MSEVVASSSSTVSVASSSSSSNLVSSTKTPATQAFLSLRIKYDNVFDAILRGFEEREIETGDFTCDELNSFLLFRNQFVNCCGDLERLYWKDNGCFFRYNNPLNGNEDKAIIYCMSLSYNDGEYRFDDDTYDNIMVNFD